MEFLSKLYVSDGMKGREAESVEKLKNGTRDPFLYAIVLSTNEDSQLDLISSLMLFMPGKYDMDRDQLLVAGISFTKDEGIELIARIAAECYEKTGGCDMRSYLSGKERCI